jgi:hypothetical protein
METILRIAFIEIDEEIERHRTGQGTVGTPQQLECCKAELASIQAAIRRGVLPPKVARTSGMGRMIVDSWPLDSNLGNILLEVEHEYQRL